MKEDLRSRLRPGLSPGDGLNVIREYCQARILGSLQRSGAMIPLAFQGGTALRFLYSLHRYSEDLDFALERPESGYDFRKLLTAVDSELTREGYSVQTRLNDRRTVHSAFVQFPGLLWELGFSPHRNEALSIKIEVDTRPPAGAILASTVVRRHLTLRLQHHDRSSLFAGKLQAILQRPYVKGRDLYDLVWYLSDPTWPGPNLELLNNALRQTEWPGPLLVEGSWRQALRDRLQNVEWERVIADVRPFLESREEEGLLTKETVFRLLS